MHQHLRFQLALTALSAWLSGTDVWGAAQVTRHPYPQSMGTTQVTFLWRTATPVRQTFQYGTNGNFQYAYSDTAATTHHEITLVDLEPGTRYEYRLRQGSEILVEGLDCWFKTDRGPSETQFTFFVTADVGEDDPLEARQEHTQAMIRRVQPRAEFGLLAGDIVYPAGESERYDPQFMTPWRPLLANTTLWPALGNHDWRSDPDSNFTREWALPNNEHYYSFDYGNAHFIALDTARSYIYDQANQLAWLEADLMANDADWTFVYYHHPLLTCTYKGNQPEIAALFFPLFEQYGVDVVFNGHAHTFERLYPLVDGLPVDQLQDPVYQDPQGPICIVSGCGGKFKQGEPTTFCGPTAAFVDERILFTLTLVYGDTIYIVTFDSFTGELVDWVSVSKTAPPTDTAVALPPFRLHQNVPNPFNPTTIIPFEMPKGGWVRARVFRPDGTWILNLADRVYPFGRHQLRWNGRDQNGMPVASGVYVCRVETRKTSESIKMMLVR